MDWLTVTGNIRDNLKKYRYVVAVLLVGVFLMMLPHNEQTSKELPITIDQKKEITLQEELEALLSQLQGAGRVKVLLTESAGVRNIFQMNENTEETETSGSVRKETVIVTNSGRGEEALVQQTLAPVYLGAVILCQGADSATVRLSIIEAVSSATGLATHNISVLKMK